MFMLDNKAQVSFDYLLTVTFGIIIAIFAAILALNIGSIAELAQERVLNYREDMLEGLTSE